MEAAKRFFQPDRSQIHNPLLMADMEKAVTRVIRAIDRGENILVYGDYDVDGTTAVALVSSYLEKYSDQIHTYIPDRYKEGYGLSEAGVQFAADNDFSVIIALDCGIKAFSQALMAKELDIDLIVCDHHTPAEELPEAYAVLDPKRKDCKYPYKELSGCGVGYKLCCAIEERRGGKAENLDGWLDLLAVSIGADIVPITGENRVLALLGLERLNRKPRPAFDLIIREARKTEFNITDVVFTIAPRINAAGRIYHGSKAVELLTCTNHLTAQKVLDEVNRHNQERKNLDSSITDEALLQVEASDLKFTNVVYREDWHKGVIGIVASRLIENYYRPTIVFTQSNGHLAGSARSVQGFSVYNAIEACSEHLIQFGGHKYAAGMTMELEKFDDFRYAFDKYVGEHITEEHKSPELIIDAEFDPSEFSMQFMRRLKLMHPHGPENDLPTFSMKLPKLENAKAIGSDKSHLKFTANGIDCIAFGMAKKIELLEDSPIEIAFHIEENEFRGNVKPQFRVVGIREVRDER